MADRRTTLPPSCVYIDTTIASSGTDSQAIDLFGMNMVGILFPSEMTGTSMTFKASVDGSNYYTCYDSAGSAVSLTVTADGYVLLTPSDFAGVRYIKLVSGSSEGAERTIKVIMRVL